MNITRRGESTAPVLSILICTIKTRRELFARLMIGLLPQIQGQPAEIVIGEDDGELIVGTKRNLLRDQARGEYSCFVDDDDLLSGDYVERIVGATKLKPDAIGFRVRRLVDQKYDADAIISMRFDRWSTETRDGQRIYLRTHNHLSPIRREIAMIHRFPEKNTAEDRDFSVAVKPHIKDEVFLDGKPLYIYEYRTRRQRANERVNQRK